MSETVSKIQEILQRQERLDPELQLYFDLDSGMYAIRHPLVYAVPYFEGMDALYNEQLGVLRARLDTIREVTEDAMKRCKQIISTNELEEE